MGVDSDGKKVEKVPSIYDEKVMLREASVDEYLSMAVKSVYQLQIDENKEALLKILIAARYTTLYLTTGQIMRVTMPF